MSTFTRIAATRIAATRTAALVRTFALVAPMALAPACMPKDDSSGSDADAGTPAACTGLSGLLGGCTGNNTGGGPSNPAGGTGAGAGNAGSGAGNSGAGNPGAGNVGAGGSDCANACDHVLTCLNVSDDSAAQQCVTACTQNGVSAADISQLTAMSCDQIQAAYQQSNGGGGTDNTGNTGNPAGGGDACTQACQALTTCGLCIQDASGACLAVATCAQNCNALANGAQVAQCVLNAGCDTTAIGNCITAASGGAGGGSSGSGSGGSDCNGCVWDGSACMWYSQSDWGAGDYSGAATECASSCCGR